MTDVRESDGLVTYCGEKYQEFSLGCGPGDKQLAEKFQEEGGDGEA